MPVRNYDAIIENGTYNFVHKTYVLRDIAESFEDKDKVTITIKSRRKPRSLKQNAYMHMCMQMIADETGNSLERVKSTLKAMYAKKPLLDKEGEQIFDPTTGEAVFYIQNTSDFSTIEAFEFTENVRMFAQDFCNLYVPLPDENIELPLK